jgi:hypothetical protein
MPEFTDEQILTTIGSALRKRDIEAIPGLLAVLTVQNPRLAETVRDGILIAAKAAS